MPHAAARAGACRAAYTHCFSAYRSTRTDRMAWRRQTPGALDVCRPTDEGHRVLAAGRRVIHSQHIRHLHATINKPAVYQQNCTYPHKIVYGVGEPLEGREEASAPEHYVIVHRTIYSVHTPDLQLLHLHGFGEQNLHSHTQETNIYADRATTVRDS